MTNNVIARTYRIAHSSVILDFDITIRVENTIIDDALVPTLVDYDGDWDIPMKKREPGAVRVELQRLADHRAIKYTLNASLARPAIAPHPRPPCIRYRRS